MSLAITYARAQVGIEAPLVSVETHVANGLPSFALVGLPEAAVRESRERVRAALLTCGYEVPPRRITVNLAPADLPKEGGRFDLAMALGLLGATGQLPADGCAPYECLGELALSGVLRPVPGVLPAALRARDAGRALIVPHENAAEAARVSGAQIFAAGHLREVVAHLLGVESLPRAAPGAQASAPPMPDLREVRGQHRARRALEIAAAGGHNLLMIGPPGAGKSMLAQRLPGILPPMTEAEALESAALWSVSSQGFDEARWGVRPFRAPHHTASGIALIGGGSTPRPGEISLAHHGVLFLDELPEFDRRALEVLREPMETGRIVISRAARQVEFPAAFQLIAAMNPSPKGDDSDPEAGRRYRARLSGPLLDRIDLQLEVPAVPKEHLRLDAPAEGEPSAVVRARVEQARAWQMARAGKPNARLGPEELARWARLGMAEARLLEQAMERLGLSMRGRDKVLRVARTIADLAGSETIRAEHLAEAIGYRDLGRYGFG
ncbi:MAG: YifB family Mg chelatase-like AAA ATPase [Pseudomonadota bacterium]|jgi:magnesium chelatase family protein